MTLEAGSRPAFGGMVAAVLFLVLVIVACASTSTDAPRPVLDGPDGAEPLPDAPGGDAGAPRLAALVADVVPGSFVRLTWQVEHAERIDVFALHDDETVAPMRLADELPGEATELVVPIPERARQTLLVVARAAQGRGHEDARATVVPSDVVVTEADYDARFGAAPVPGSLRSILADASPGAVIGFAADVQEVHLVGIDGAGVERAHMRIGGGTSVERVTISGPAWTGAAAPYLTIRSAPHLRFVERASVVAIAGGADVALHNLRIAGGGFTERGGGIHNAGTLTIVDSVIEDNRSWFWGGGIYNEGGALSLTRVRVTGNVAAVLNEEPDGVPTTIDGQPGFIEFCTPVPNGDCETVIIGDRGGAGGGLQNIDGDVTIIDSVFERNHARFSGGGLCNIGGYSLIID